MKSFEIRIFLWNRNKRFQHKCHKIFTKKSLWKRRKKETTNENEQKENFFIFRHLEEEEENIVVDLTWWFLKWLEAFEAGTWTIRKFIITLIWIILSFVWIGKWINPNRTIEWKKLYVDVSMIWKKGKRGEGYIYEELFMMGMHASLMGMLVCLFSW